LLSIITTIKEVKPVNTPLRVRNLVRRHDTSDPFRLATELNCIVYFLDLPPNVNGFWKQVLRRRTIAINKNLEEWQQAAVLCHELGHVVCHPRYAAFSMHHLSFSNSRIEHEANEFAECLMAYRYDLDEYYVSRFLAEGWHP
jgi:hypothetical protein